MTVRIAALVLGLVGTAAAECPPSARVTGEPAVVEAVARLLRERGVVVVDTAAEVQAFQPEGCSHVTASVATGGGRIMVWIVDPDGRRAERLTEDTIAAATTIESWARRDLVSPLLASRSMIPIDDVSTPAVTQAATSSAPGASYTLVVGIDAGVSNDRSVWTAARAQGCIRVGRVCIGGILRYAYDTHQTGATATYDTHRTGIDVSVTVGVPFGVGPLSVMPFAGLGQLGVTATRDLDPMEVIPQKETEQTSAIHGVVGGSASARLRGQWSLRADVAGLLAPFARQALGDAAELDILPASPKLQFWFGVGLAYGAL